MLVLSRRAGESIVIGKDITVKVVSVRGSGENAVIRLGIDAPDQVGIWRSEILSEVRSEMEKAAESSSSSNLDEALKAARNVLSRKTEE